MLKKELLAKIEQLEYELDGAREDLLDARGDLVSKDRQLNERTKTIKSMERMRDRIAESIRSRLIVCIPEVERHPHIIEQMERNGKEVRFQEPTEEVKLLRYLEDVLGENYTPDNQIDFTRRY